MSASGLPAAVTASAIAGIPEISPGDDLAAVIVRAAGADRLPPDAVLAIAHTAVSKAEGALVSLADVAVGERAAALGAAQQRDPREVQVVLDQSIEVLREERVLICRTRHGFVCANAGVDASNSGSPDTLVLLPRDPDASARALRARLRELLGERAAPAVLISDSFGRPWRNGQVDVAIGVAGMEPLQDWRGLTDADGMRLKATWLAVADGVAAAADLARSKDSREPAVILGGLGRFVTDHDGPGAAPLLRTLDEDLFR